MDRRTWTDFNSFIRRNRKRFLIRQEPVVIWLTGLSGAGKSTIASSLEKELQRRGYFTKNFDGDIIRLGLCKDLGFSQEDRTENIRRIAEMSRIFLDTGLIVICSFISPTKEARDLAKEIIGENSFLEVYVNCPLEVCEKRDVKGLYKKARMGEIKNFTGIDSIYEAPEHPLLNIRTDLCTVKQATKRIMKEVGPRIKFKTKLYYLLEHLRKNK